MKIVGVLFLCCVISPCLIGQVDFDGCYTTWSDTYSSWTFYRMHEEEEITGSMDLRWKAEEDWSKWDFRFGEVTGSVEALWAAKFDDWILKGRDGQVRMAPRWLGDHSEWRLRFEDIPYPLEMIHSGNLEEWVLTIDDTTYVQIFTEVQGDVRSWTTYRHGATKVSPLVELAAMFIVVWTSVPHL